MDDDLRPVGAEPSAPLPPSDPEIEPPTEPELPARRSRKKLAIVVAVAISAFGLAVVAAVVLSGETTENKYLDALRYAGLRDGFPTDRAAVVNAEKACLAASETGVPRGSKADRIGVRYYCAEYEEAFKVLEELAVKGSFTLFESYELTGEHTCSGEGGFGDVNGLTRVIVSNGAGQRLARSELGMGIWAPGECRFHFEFTILEGEEQYVVEVGDRGEASYSFEELKRAGPALSLGG